MTENITYYYVDPAGRDRGFTPAGEAVAAVTARLDAPEVRWPVRNREEREEFSSHKRALIFARDGKTCHVCGSGGAYVLDHIIPRSAFRVEDLRIADRSDNLACACWDCNETKSNHRRQSKKRLGVVDQCGDCARGYGYAASAEQWEDDNASCADYYGVEPWEVLPVFCGNCGPMGRVPGLEWVW